MRLILLGFLALTVVVGGWLFVTFAERSNMPAGSFTARLLMPKELRALELPEQCAAAFYTRTFIECGGVCGTRYQMKFGTTASTEFLSAYLDEVGITDTLSVTSTEVHLSDEADTCGEATVAFRIDERDAP